MSITALADRLITVLRRTALVLDAAPVEAAMALDRDPPRATLFEVVLSGGTAATGTVRIEGDGPDGASTETLTFTGPGRQVTTKRYTTATITTTGLASEAVPPTIEILAVGPDGARVEGRVEVVAAAPMRKDAGTANWRTPSAGSAESEIAVFYADHSTVWAPRRGDVLVDTISGEEWTVIGDPRHHGGGLRAPHHVEIRAQETTGAASG